MSPRWTLHHTTRAMNTVVPWPEDLTTWHLGISDSQHLTTSHNISQLLACRHALAGPLDHREVQTWAKMLKAQHKKSNWKSLEEKFKGSYSHSQSFSISRKIWPTSLPSHSSFMSRSSNWSLEPKSWLGSERCSGSSFDECKMLQPRLTFHDDFQVLWNHVKSFFV